MSVGHLGEMRLNRDNPVPEALPSNFRTEGWVYVLSNEYMPGIYKVGMTTISPENRAKELSSATGVPDKFKVEASFYSECPSNDESEIHEYLSEYRINDSREFFKCALEDIVDTCSEVCLARVGDDIADIADSFDIICTHNLDELRLGDLFESLGLNVFGCKLSAAERLIRLAAQLLHNKFTDQHSLYFTEDTAYLVKSTMGKQYDEYLKNEEEANNSHKLANKPEVPF